MKKVSCVRLSPRFRQCVKEADFEVTDHIVLSMEGNEKLKAITEKNEDSVKKDVLAEAVAFGSTDGYVKEWNINGETVTLGVKKA